MTETPLLIGIDIGGTDLKATLTDPSGQIFIEISTPTLDIIGRDNSQVWKASVKRLIDELERKASGPIAAIGISTPGTVDHAHSHVLSNGTKMLGIEGHVWNDYLDRPVFVINDAHAALYAESRIGSAVGYREVVMLTLGTGVGGAILLDDKIYQGQVGRAGHLGHMSVNDDTLLDIVKTPGSLEDAIGESTVKLRSHGKYQTTKALVQGYQDHEPFASWVWLQSIRALSRGLISLINILSPELILLGGGITRAGEALMTPLESFMELYEWRPKGHITPVHLAKMGNSAGSLGAALFAWDKTKGR